MAEFSGFFDSHLVDGKYDRTYLAEHFAKYFASFIGNGIFGGNSNELMVLQKESANMSVRVQKGKAFINGYFYENDDELLLPLDLADGVLNRIDLIILRFDNIERVIRLAVKKGTPASNANAPSLQRDSDYYELALAEVYVRAGATSIIQMNITDKRLDNSVCGLVQGVVQQFDTTSFGAQIDSFIRNFEAYNTTKMNEVLARLNAMADNNDLASLIVDIENLEKADEEIKSEATIVNQTIGYTRKNILPFPFTSQTVTNNGITFTVNNDGTVTANGTATANAYFTLYRGKAFELGKYIVSSSIDAQGKYFSYIRYVDKATSLEVSGTTIFGFNNDQFEITEENATAYDMFVGLTVSRGQTVSNVIFKPMVRKAEIIDSTWEPYKKSVSEDIDYFKKLFTESKENPGCYYHTLSTGEVEWVNPPNEVGLTYRTMERWNGNPVYEEVLYVGRMTNKTVMTVNSWAKFSNVISVEGFAIDWDDNTTYKFPIIINGIATAAAITKIEDGGDYSTIVIQVNEDLSNFVGYVKVKYTKSDSKA